ncbi:ABC transporter ATP-binding protein [bacterium]|nr:ABC transporter ATP-binding protein [bacterium]
MEPENVIEIKGLSKRFRVYDRPLDRLKEWLTPIGMSFHWAYWALRDVDLTVKKGSSLGIIGVNGAGKSTLLKILCGTLSPTFGSVEIKGRIAGLLELGSGFHPEFTGRQNIYLNARLLGLSDADIEKKLQSIVEFAELGDFLDHPLRIYSTGMALRLGFSVAANVDPDILIIDEALAVGDAYFQQKCLKYLKDFRAKGGTLIFVSHDPGAVKLLCDSAVLLHKGRIVANDTPENVLNFYNTLLVRDDSDKESFILERKKLEAENSKPQHSGSFEALIEKVSLISDNCETRTLFAGHKAELKVTVKALNDIEPPTVGFSLRDRLGYEVLGTNTMLLKKELPALKAGEGLTVGFDLPPFLGPGEYTVTVAAHPGRDHVEHCYDWTDRMLAFKVALEDESQCVGLLNIPVTASFEKVETDGRDAQDILESAFSGASSEIAITEETNRFLTTGFYPPEKIGESCASWTGARAVFVLKSENAKGLVIRCATDARQLEAGPLSLTLNVNGKFEITKTITTPDWQEVEFPFESEEQGMLRCSLMISSTFIPENDKRALGILVSKIALR